MNNYNFKTLVVVLVYLYLFLSQGFMLYFWYNYSQNHSFIKTLIIGPFVSEIKGFLFPFFI